MKKKSLLLSLFLAVALLFSIVFQSFHGYEHLEKRIAEKICYHKHANKAELTHQHKSFDHCLLCTFTFSSYVSPQDFSYQFYSIFHEVPYFGFDAEIVLLFSGSLYSLRGPPVCI